MPSFFSVFVLLLCVEGVLLFVLRAAATMVMTIVCGGSAGINVLSDDSIRTRGKPVHELFSCRSHEFKLRDRYVVGFVA